MIECQYIHCTFLHFLYDYFTLQLRSTKESITETVHVVGSLEHLWSGSTLLCEKQLATLPRHKGCFGTVLLMEFSTIARVTSVLLHEMITLLNFNKWITITMVQCIPMLKFKTNA